MDGSEISITTKGHTTMTTLSTPNRPRARQVGALGLALSALLSPSGKIISSAAAASVLVGTLVTQFPPLTPPAVQVSAPPSAASIHLAHRGSSAPALTYIDDSGPTLPVVLTENPTGNSSSAGRGPASASPATERSGGRGPMPGMGSPGMAPHHGRSPLPSTRPVTFTPEITHPSGLPITDALLPSTGSGTPPATSIPPAELCIELMPGELIRDECVDDRVAQHEPGATPAPPSPQGESPNEPHKPIPGNAPGLVQAPAPQLPPASEAGAPAPPPQGAPLNELLEPFPGNAPGPLDELVANFPPGTDDPLNLLNPLIPLAAQPKPLAGPNDGQSPSLTTGSSPVAVPEPSTIGLILLGLAALAWANRPRLAAARRV